MEIFSSVTTLAIIYFSILAISSIGTIISEKAGIVNIGMNGSIIFGATIYMIFASMFSNWNEIYTSEWLQIPLFLFSALGGLIFSSLHGYATIKLKANQIISGIALNILAPAITLLILTTFGDADRIYNNIKPLAVGNNALGEWTGIISLSTFVMILVVIISWISLNKTKWGLRLRSIGENPQAADAVGINVNAFKWQAILISGLLAGLAGAIFMSAPFKGSSFNGSVEGLGFLAIAIMIIGRWKVLPAAAVSFLFSFLLSIGQKYSSFFSPDLANYKNIISYQYLFLTLPYVITLIAMIIFAGKSIGPKAVGIPYDKALR